MVDVETGKRIHTFDIPDSSMPSGKVNFGHDGTLLYAISYDKLFVLSVSERKPVATFSHIGWHRVAVSSDGQVLAEARSYHPPGPAKGSGDRRYFQVHLTTLDSERTPRKVFAVEEGTAERVAFTSDGQYVFVNVRRPRRDNRALSTILWKVKTKERFVTDKAYEGRFYHVFSEKVFKDRYVILADAKWERNRVLDLSSGEVIPIQADKLGRVLIIGIAPDGENCVVNRYVPTERPQNWMALGRLQRMNAPMHAEK